MPFTRHHGVLVTGSAGVLAALLFSKRENFQLTASAVESEQQGPREYEYKIPPQQQWDYNWDKMAPTKTEEGKEVAKSTASRTLILIRHGQYIWDPDYPEKRILTELGRKQAAITAQRLKHLGLSYNMLHYSTMPRATETAEIILQNLGGTPSLSCDLMREGAPIKPVPMHRHWRPESYVSHH